MKKGFIFLGITVRSALAADPVLLSQYQFNTIINTYEVSQVVNVIRNNNTDHVQIAYQQAALLSAIRLKSEIQQQTSLLNINLVLNSYSFPLFGGAAQNPLTVYIYGTQSSIQNINASVSASSASFYGYTTENNSFYLDGNGDN